MELKVRAPLVRSGGPVKLEARNPMELWDPMAAKLGHKLNVNARALLNCSISVCWNFLSGSSVLKIPHYGGGGPEVF